MSGAPCPICERKSPLSKTFPFCSDRCRAADLGAWLGQSYAVAAPALALESHATGLMDIDPEQGLSLADIDWDNIDRDPGLR